MEDFFSKQLEGLSEVSEELDANRWKIRFDGLSAAVMSEASGRDNLLEWGGAWIPALFALQQFGATLGRLVWSLRDAVTGSGDHEVFTSQVVAQIKEDFDGIVETFPDSGHWLVGIDELDNLIRAIVEDPAARATVMEVGAALGQLGDDILGRVVHVILDGEDHNLDVGQLTFWIENLEGVLQSAIDALDLHRRLFEDG